MHLLTIDITASDEPWLRCQKCALGMGSLFHAGFMRILDGFLMNSSRTQRRLIDEREGNGESNGMLMSIDITHEWWRLWCFGKQR